MSAPGTPEPATSGPAEQPHAVDIATGRKSYRRKYRKIMVSFERKMRESTTLFRDEQKVLDISQRLAEQTDQLLQLLVDLNSCPQVPRRLRYDVRPKHIAKGSVLGQDTTYTEEAGHLALRKARHQLQTGEFKPAEYAHLKDRLVETSDFAPNRSYAALTEVVSAVNVPRNENRDSPETSGFLTAKQEDQYTQSLDAYLNGDAPASRSHATTSLGMKSQEKTADRERETQLRNPVSVYNWLRRNKPSVFLQDNESKADKPVRPAGARSSKRNAIRDSLVKEEDEENYGGEGTAVDAGASKGKRKRDDDGGYRPKGGNSRPTKRKKEDTSSGRRSKKGSIDVR